MSGNIINTIVKGPLWLLNCMALIILFTLLFTCAPIILIEDHEPLPTAYALKSEKPFADTSKLFPPSEKPGNEQSHGAKLTPRLVGSIFLWLARKTSSHPYLPATLFGIIYLLAGLLVAYRITGDRVVGLFTGLLFSGLYTASACFALNWMPKPFDGVAVGLLGLTLLAINRPWWLLLAAFLSCWTDERTIIALFFIAVVVFAWPSMAARARYVRCAILAGAVVLYAITRVILASALGWSSPDTSMIGVPLTLSASASQLAAWSIFEGGWIPVTCSLWLLLKRRSYPMLAFFTVSLVVALATSLVVLDVSRSGMFSFPLILAAISIMKCSNIEPGEMRRIIGWSAGITLLAPNFEVIMGVIVQWLPSYFVYILTNTEIFRSYVHQIVPIFPQ